MIGHFDDKELKLFIEENFKVSSNRSPFYISWIKKFITYVNNSDSNENILDVFINSLDSKYPDWQVKQADKAVTIYLSFIRKNDNSNSKNRIEENSSWKIVIFDMKEEIRLQNKSLQTEKSYIYWVKKFSSYVHLKTPEIVNQDDVKAFLTYLAIERSVSISTQNQVRMQTRAVTKLRPGLLIQYYFSLGIFSTSRYLIWTL